jgi:hypothetical protein
LSPQNAVTDANPRDIYLLQTLGLKHDPFAYATAELELQINSDDPPFLTYFVDLPVGEGKQGLLLEELQKPGHTVVYGEIGSGKTTLRYALEAQCRGLAQRVLVVSEELGKGDPETTVPTLQTLTQALATDLFVQTIERFDTLLSIPDASLTAALSRFWHQNIPNFHRSVTRHLQQGQPPDTPTGISPWWRTWKRVVVRYTPLTKARKQFLEQVLALGKEKRERGTAVPSTTTLQQGISLAQQLGYQQLYYLLDAADTPEFNITTLLNHLNQINGILPNISQIPLSLKLFLPQRTQAELQGFLSQTENRLISPSFSAIIQWNYSLLHALIENRFRSAGSWIRGIEVLASQESPVKLERELIQSAQQSPRRLLQILSLLINTHANRTAIEPTFTNADLKQTLQLWSHNPSSLTPPTVNNVINEGMLYD